VSVAEPLHDVRRTAGEGAETDTSRGNLEGGHPVTDALVSVVHRT
jgi:hypothetical protein